MGKQGLSHSASPDGDRATQAPPRAPAGLGHTVSVASADDERAEPDELVWLRDLDGTGSMHVCTPHDPGAIAYYREDVADPEPRPIFMVRVEVENGHEPPWDVWFRERSEMDAFLLDRPKELTVTDIHERGVNTAQSALEAVAEYIADSLNPDTPQ